MQPQNRCSDQTMMALDPRAVAAGHRLMAHEVLGSTNAEALRLARQGDRGPVWIVADRQLAGRGRRERSWISELGNLFATLLLPSPGPSGRWPQLSLVAALAVYDAISETASALASAIRIKWPNDILLEHAKLAGILLECDGGQHDAIAVGIGINCASHPVGTQHPATNLAAAGIAMTPAMLLPPLSAKMMARLAQWNQGENFSAVRADWTACAAGLGENVSVRVGHRSLCGRFEGLDEDGSLVLRQPDGRAKRITAADMSILSA
jgi:BirA family biotin operon repressor/biotin-[acetyl-CoA-carboxylase] ligase